MDKSPSRATVLTPSTVNFAQCLYSALSFPKTYLGNRQKRTWERLISYIESSTCTFTFEKAAAYAEGYAHALVDSDQIEISIERDVLVIEMVDAWRRIRNTSTNSTNL